MYDADGRWIGLVSLRNVSGPHLVVQQGRLRPRDISAPVRAIAQIDDAGISLHQSRGALKQYA